MNSSSRLLIFDLDGTVADTLEAIREAVNLTMRRFGWPERTYDEVRLAVGNGARKIVERSMPKDCTSDPALVDRALAEYDALYGQTYLHTDRCYPGIPETVAELKKRGFRLAMLSNKQDPYVRSLAAQLFPAGTFDLVRGQTDKPKKPDPTVPLEFIAALHLQPSRCVMIGDSSVDIQTGKNAGMLTVGCSWGFRPRSSLEEAGADYIVDRPEELLALPFVSSEPNR